MNDLIKEKVKTLTIRQLIVNIENDLKEDGDTGVNLEMTIEEYLINLFS